MAATVESPPDEFTASTDDHHHHPIVTKRKRTKRPRPSSPFTSVTTTTTSTTATTTSCSSVTAVTEFHGGESISHAAAATTTTTTTVASVHSPIIDGSTVTEEEEVVANCLILLAQSGEHGTGSEKTKTRRKVNPVAVKSPTTMKVMIGGERGYGYECQTCNRTFNSFQALGGHRTSHKRPKLLPPIDHHHHQHEPQLEPYNGNPGNESHQQHENTKSKLKLNQIVSAAADVAATVISPDAGKLQFVSRKVHQCSICGAEFSSGQALGGHMRRHRPLTTTVPQMTTPITPSIVAADEKCDTEQQHQQQEGRKVLPLDLNFPAPDENDHRGDTKFQFVFTLPPPLVDCHF